MSDPVMTLKELAEVVLELENLISKANEQAMTKFLQKIANYKSTNWSIKSSSS